MPLYWTTAASGRVDHVVEHTKIDAGGYAFGNARYDDDYQPALCGADPVKWYGAVSSALAEPGVPRPRPAGECKKCRKALDGRAS